MKQEILEWKDSKKGNSTNLVSFFEQIVSKYKGKKIAFILDTVSHHKSRETKDWLTKNPNVALFYLPTYSPEYNPIEQVWKWLKPNFRYKLTALLLGLMPR